MSPLMVGAVPLAVSEGFDRDSGLKVSRVVSGVSVLAECYGVDAASNAALFAAAPKLLAALQAIIGEKPDRYGYFAARNAMDDDKREAAIEAIALAKGGAA